MAEIFVCLWDKHRQDNAEHSNNNWRNGFVVTIKDDGSPWGRMEDPRVWLAEGNLIADWQPLGKFAIIRAPGTDYLQAVVRESRPAFMSEPEFVMSDEADQRTKWTRRRRWKIDTSGHPELATDGISIFDPVWIRLW